MRPLLGIEAFGVAAWVRDAGEQVVVDHTESEDGQEELYVVLTGRARFVIGEDEEVAAAVGTCVAVRPGVRRRAAAEADGTSVLAVGAQRGAAYQAPGWEHSAVGADAYRRGDFATAVTLLRPGPVRASRRRGRGLQTLPAARPAGGSGRRRSSTCAARSSSIPRSRHARSDSDLEAIRDDPRFSAVVGAMVAR